MHQLSDGQRRRVQIMLQLLRPCEVLFLDEITTDLDLITRQVRGVIEVYRALVCDWPPGY